MAATHRDDVRIVPIRVRWGASGADAREASPPARGLTRDRHAWRCIGCVSATRERRIPDGLVAGEAPVAGWVGEVGSRRPSEGGWPQAPATAGTLGCADARRYGVRIPPRAHR